MAVVVEVPSEQEFALYQELIYKKLGIHLPKQKRAMLGHRLLRRLRALDIPDFSSYYQFITKPKHADELKEALELVTTNETFFFREIQHFTFLKDEIIPKRRIGASESFRVWSAACSTGEEPYSIAMTLAKYCLRDWSILATDVNDSVITHARKGIYLDERMTLLSGDLRRRYCRRGTEEFAGHLRVVPDLRRRVCFKQFNLLDDMSAFGQFDLIFLRNVLIYFDEDSKVEILNRIARQLKPGGYLFTGHSESFHGACSKLDSIRPAIMQLR